MSDMANVLANSGPEKGMSASKNVAFRNCYFLYKIKPPRVLLGGFTMNINLILVFKCVARSFS